MHLSALLTCNQESVLSFADSISWKTVRRSPLSCCFSSCFIRSFFDNFAGFAEVGLGALTFESFESFEILPAMSSLISLVISPSFLAGTGVQCTAGIDKCIKKHSHMQHHATSCNRQNTRADLLVRGLPNASLNSLALSATHLFRSPRHRSCQFLGQTQIPLNIFKKTGLPCTMPESKHLQNVVHSSTWVLFLENCFPPAAKGLFDFNVCSR